MIIIENNDIKKILQYPFKDEVMDILKNANLTHKETSIIELMDMKGYTKQKSSGMLGISQRTLYTYRKNAYDKLKVYLNNNPKALEILRTR